MTTLPGSLVLWEPVRVTNLYVEIVGRLKEEIARGTLEEGERLPSERKLAAELGVSRASVREAIADLQNDGIVHTRHGAGSFIADGARAKIAGKLEEEGHADAVDASPLSLLEVRAFIEPAIARLAASFAQPSPQVEELLARMDNTVDDLDHPTERAVWSDSDRLFHYGIAVMTANPFLIEIAARIAEVMDQPLWRRLRDDALFQPGRVRLYAGEHRLIYEAIIGGDIEASGFYAERHIARVRMHMGLD